MLYLRRLKAVFLHIPKTGGTFVRRAIAELGVCHREPPAGHANLDYARRTYGDDLQYFCFVRHPLAWLQSFWADRVYGKDFDGDHATQIKAECHSDKFNEFVRHVLERQPGVVSRLFASYAGEGVWVGRQENLIPDLLGFLDALRWEQRAGDDPRKILLGMGHHNAAARNMPDMVRYEPEVERAVLEAEREAVERWYA